MLSHSALENNGNLDLRESREERIEEEETNQYSKVTIAI